MSEKVFVYGSLLSNCHNHRYLQNKDCTLLGESRLAGFIMKDLGNYPAVYPVGLKEAVIFGEVWKISINTLSNLDILEGHPNFYTRIQVHTEYGQAWIYINNNVLKYPTVDSGDWKEYIKDTVGL